MSAPLDEDGELLAMELAFGLLDRDEAAAARARLLVDRSFAEAAARWDDSLADGTLDHREQPRPSLWSGIVGRLPANDTAPDARSAGGWKIATAAATVAAVALGIYSLRPQPTRVVVRQIAVERTRPAPTLAVLTSTAGPTAVAISIDRAAGVLRLVPVELELRTKVPELWVIPAGGQPHSLGVATAGFAGAIKPSPTALALVTPGATLAISAEPAGGSPTGLPTGRIVVTGKVPLVS